MTGKGIEQPGRDWNEGHPDHEGEMAVTQLHRIIEMAEEFLDSIGENDELPGWIQYKIGRAYTDLSDAFGYIEAESHKSGVGLEEGKKKKRRKKKNTLWGNIRARRAAGKPRLKPGQKGYPKTLDIESVLRKTIQSLVELELKK